MKKILFALVFMLLVHDPYLRSEDGIAFSSPEISIPSNYVDHWLRLQVQRMQSTDQVCEVSITLLDSLITSYKDRLYFLADANAKAIDQNPVISAEVERMARTIITQINGPLYTDVILNNISVSPQEIEDAYEHRTYTLDIQYVYLPESTPAYVDTTDVQHVFDDIETIQTNCIGAQYVETTLVWPFKDLYPFRESIDNATIGSTSFYHDVTGDYIVHIMGRNALEQKSFSEVIEYLRFVLHEAKRSYLEKCHEEQLLNDAQFMIRPDEFVRFSSRMKYSSALDSIDPAAFEDIGEHVLATYDLGNNHIAVTVSSFISYYNNKILHSSLSTQTTLYDYIKECAFEQLAYADAERRGLTHTDEFLAEKMHFRQNVTMVYYDEYLMSQIDVADTDIQREYQSHIAQFTETTECKTSILQFATREDAYNTYATLQNRQQIPPDDQVQGCIHISRDTTISCDDTTLPHFQQRELFSEPEQKVIQPYSKDNITYLVIKHAETEHRTIPLEAVRDRIVATLKQQKLDELKAEMLPELKKKYDVIDTIDYDKYLSEEWIQSVLAENDATSTN